MNIQKTIHHLDILYVKQYKDGGSSEIFVNVIDSCGHLSSASFCIDRRLNTNTHGMIYAGYPEDDNTNIMDN